VDLGFFESVVATLAEAKNGRRKLEIIGLKVENIRLQIFFFTADYSSF
jgi:hypothetical protein